MVSKRGATTSLATQSPDAFFTRRSLQQNHPRNNTSITWDATLVMEITYEAIDFRDTVSMMSAHAKYRSTTCFVASDIDGRSAWSQNQIHTQSKRTNILPKWARQRAQGKQEYHLEAKKVTSRCRWLLVPQSCQRVEVLPLFLWAVSFALSQIENCNSPPNPKAAKSHLSPATQRIRCVMKASRISPESYVRSTARQHILQSHFDYICMYVPEPVEAICMLYLRVYCWLLPNIKRTAVESESFRQTDQVFQLAVSKLGISIAPQRSLKVRQNLV